MPSRHDRHQQELQDFRQTSLAARARLAADLPTADEADQAALNDTDPQPRRSSWFEPEQPELAPPAPSPAVAGKPRPAGAFTLTRRPGLAWMLVVPAVTPAVGMVLGFGLGAARTGSW